MNRSDLRRFVEDPSGLPRSTALLKEKGVRVVLLHLKAGEQIPQHQTPGALIVQCLAGRVNFSASGEDAELTLGSLISLEPGKPHQLGATEESLLLLTIAEQTG